MLKEYSESIKLSSVDGVNVTHKGKVARGNLQIDKLITHGC